ncbi:hypothetical protein [Georgenia sp. AZ-5]|uniref:hypothetical protein n=1 Tax=Georgenia sp. AZ-5 TaxID=3367526 RepID=UPI0037545680
MGSRGHAGRRRGGAGRRRRGGAGRRRLGRAARRLGVPHGGGWLLELGATLVDTVQVLVLDLTGGLPGLAVPDDVSASLVDGEERCYALTL